MLILSSIVISIIIILLIFKSKKKEDISTSTEKNNYGDKKIVKIALISILAIIVVAILIRITNNFHSSVEPSSNLKLDIETNNSTEKENQSTSNVLTLDDVKLETYTSINQMNTATQRVTAIGWTYITERPYKAYPNAKWTKIRISDKDNYGRFLVHYTYITSEYSSEATKSESIYIWIKDINDLNKMGYYYSTIRPSDWNKPFTDEEKK